MASFYTGLAKNLQMRRNGNEAATTKGLVFPV
jgi:hypothetical protein